MQPKEPKPLPKMIRDEDDKNSNKPNKIIFGKTATFGLGDL